MRLRRNLKTELSASFSHAMISSPISGLAPPSATRASAARSLPDAGYKFGYAGPPCEPGCVRRPFLILGFERSEPGRIKRIALDLTKLSLRESASVRSLGPAAPPSPVTPGRCGASNPGAIFPSAFGPTWIAGPAFGRPAMTVIKSKPALFSRPAADHAQRQHRGVY